MGSPLSPASKREEEAIGLVVVVVGNAATGSLSIRAGGSGDKLGIAINSYLTLQLQNVKSDSIMLDKPWPSHSHTMWSTCFYIVIFYCGGTMLIFIFKVCFYDNVDMK